MVHPVSHKDGPMKGKPDARYTVTLEHTGRDRPHYVARFCGDWIASSASYASATLAALGHDAVRRGCDVVTAVD